MNDGCLVEGCTNRVYAPGGTGSLCRDHFVKFVTWRRRRAGMFQKYGAMTMEERDTIVAEWRKTLTMEK